MNLCKKLCNSTKWSFEGLIYTFKFETAFKIELIVVLALSPIAFFLAKDLNQLLFLLISLYAVLIVELINTAIEAVVDRIGLDHHALSKSAKDAGSAAVFLSILLAAFVWIIVCCY